MLWLLPYPGLLPGGKGLLTMCGKGKLGIENGIVALPIFCHTRYNNAQGPVLGRSSSRIQLAPRKASVCHRVRKWRYEAPKSKSTAEYLTPAVTGAMEW